MPRGSAPKPDKIVVSTRKTCVQQRQQAYDERRRPQQAADYPQCNSYYAVHTWGRPATALPQCDEGLRC